MSDCVDPDQKLSSVVSDLFALSEYMYLANYGMMV